MRSQSDNLSTISPLPPPLPLPLGHLQFYQAVVGWSYLAEGVDTAFLGDQRVMQEWLARRRGTELPKASAKRGIVVPAGGANQLANAFANLFVLRHQLHCDLPVTIS